MQELVDRVKTFAQDVATLDVLTLSGTLALTPDADASGSATGAKELKWDDFFKSVVEKLKTPADDTRLEIVAYTHAEFDADSVNYYRTAEGEDELRQLHLATVEAATKNRLDAVAAFARIFS